MKEKMFTAIEFAFQAHRNHCRKDTQIPYIVHPIQVGRILYELGCSESVVLAGFLHDTVEDTEITLEEIRNQFGGVVAGLVAKCSEPDKSDTWENRKQQTLETLADESNEVLLVALADKLDNIRSLRRSFLSEGEGLWSRFNRPKRKQAWYYHSLVQVFQERLSEEPGRALVQEFCREVESVFPGDDPHWHKT